MRAKHINPFVPGWRSATILLVVMTFRSAIFSTPQIGTTDIPYKRAVDRHLHGLSSNTRISGGHDAKLADHPWQVALVAADDSDNTRAEFCGGAIIGEHWVLTAAHCLLGVPNQAAIKILVGTDTLDAAGRRLTVDYFKPHENWVKTGHDFDIALVHSSEVLTGTVALWKGTDAQFENQTFVVSGWGAIAWKPDPPRSIKLQAVPVKFVGKDLCGSAVSYGRRLTDNMFCAGDYKNGGVDACTYDSGGPATWSRQAGIYLVGIVSWGDGCGEAKKPGVYIKVSNFAQWIKTQTHQEVF
jgi:secreted trypsin-like serine protease